MLSVSPEVTISVIIITSAIGGRHRSHDQNNMSLFSSKRLFGHTHIQVDPLNGTR